MLASPMGIGRKPMNPLDYTTEVAIPATIEEATASLNGIGGLLTAKEWERAAIVYAFTEDQQGKHFDGNPSRLSITEFAKLGITGLTTREAVARYRNTWIEYGVLGIKPGDVTDLPDADWPPMSTPAQDKFVRIPEHADPADVARKVPEEIRGALAKELHHDPDVALDLVEDVTVQKERSQAVYKSLVASKQKSPLQPRHYTGAGHPGDDLAVVDIQKRLIAMRNLARTNLRGLMEDGISDEMHKSYQVVIDYLRDTADELEMVLIGTDTDAIEDFLASVGEGEEGSA